MRWNIYLSGCRIEYLPPYSPDYNPIELAFSAIKHYIRRMGDEFLYTEAPHFELYNACSIITPEDAVGFFHHCGYAV